MEKETFKPQDLATIKQWFDTVGCPIPGDARVLTLAIFAIQNMHSSGENVVATAKEEIAKIHQEAQKGALVTKDGRYIVDHKHAHLFDLPVTIRTSRLEAVAAVAREWVKMGWFSRATHKFFVKRNMAAAIKNLDSPEY